MLMHASSEKTNPTFRAFPAQKGPFLESFLHYSGVIFNINFLLFHPMLGSAFFVRGWRHRFGWPRRFEQRWASRFNPPAASSSPKAQRNPNHVGASELDFGVAHPADPSETAPVAPRAGAVS